MAGYLLLSPAAERDIEAILAWSQQRFGEEARLRYERLLARAILDVAEDPERLGSRERPELGQGVRTFHLAHSRARAEPAAGRVRCPRHLLVYRSSCPGRVEIARVLHESMDLPRHLPVE